MISARFLELLETLGRFFAESIVDVHKYLQSEAHRQVHFFSVEQTSNPPNQLILDQQNLILCHGKKVWYHLAHENHIFSCTSNKLLVCSIRSWIKDIVP